MRLGDLDALKQAIINNFDNLQAYFPKDFIEEINNAPTVNPERPIFSEVWYHERPQGEWKLHGMIYYCSECGHDCEQGGNNFCGNCGADMRGEKK